MMQNQSQKAKRKKVNRVWALCLLLGMLFWTGCSMSEIDGKNPGDITASEGDLSEFADPEKIIFSEWESIPEEEGMVDASDTLETYLKELDMLESSVREYGEGNSFQLMDEDFVARIFYPAGEVRSLSDAIDQWVMDTIDYYQEEAAGSAGYGDSAELTVDYNSYLIKEQFVGVKLYGIFDKPYLAHPIDVSATFNASRETGRLLDLEDLFREGGIAVFRDMVAVDAKIPEENLDDGILDHWMLTSDGLEITLVRGDYLPMSDGTKVLLYPYTDLASVLAEGSPLLDGSTGETHDADAPAGDSKGGQETEEQHPQQDPEENPAEQESSSDASAPEEVQTPGNAETDENSESTEAPMLALTFDDGPSTHTGRLLDIFAEHGGKGTFFIVGNMIDTYPEFVKRTAAEGHELGGHSWNHRQLTKLGTEELKDQMMMTRAKILDVTGKDTLILRPPYGSSNKDVEAIAGSLGIALVNWSVDTLDWKNKNPEAVKKVILDQAADGAIILCHDLHKTTVDAMESVIPELIAKGYRLVTVSELLSSKGGTVIPGKMYYKR